MHSALLVTPAPSCLHQRVLRELFLRLHAHLTHRPGAEVIFSPGDERPEVLPERIGWRVDGKEGSLGIDLTRLFADPLGD